MRSLALLIAAVALPGQAAPPSALRSFDQALAAGHVMDATAIVDKLIADRTPAYGKPRPDPLLNAMIGRLYLAANNFAAAGTYLDAAPIGSLPAPLRAETALAHGRTLEAEGRRAAATAAYGEALAASSNETDRQQATVAIARTLLPDDPAAARARVDAIATGPMSPVRWEARAIQAAATSLQGDIPGAEKLAHDAWADAGDAPLASSAPLSASVLRAGLAAARHDVMTERAMLAAASGLSVTANPGLGAQLPVCGTAGVRASDFVIFGYSSGPYANRQLLPISASRPEIVRTFHDALSLTVPVTLGGDSHAPFGTVFTAACRTVVSTHVLTKPFRNDPFLDWSVGQGVYPGSAMFYSDDKHLNRVAVRIDALTARFGKDSPLLIGPRWQQLMLFEARQRTGKSVPASQVAELSSALVAGLRRAGAPNWIASTIENHARVLQAATSDSSEAGRPNPGLPPITQMPPETGRAIIALMTSLLRDDWPAPAAQFVLDSSSTITPAVTGLERQSWLLTVAQAQRILLRDSEAAATLASAQLAPDLCVRMDQQPKLLEQHFSYDDYPQEFIQGDQQGAVLFDFDLTATGAVGRRRIIYSLPSGLFDQVSETGLETVRYLAPLQDAKPSSCRGTYQPIVWRLEPGSQPDPGTAASDDGAADHLTVSG